MPRYAYVDGRYLRHDEARVHVEDRGFQFADGVYEVIRVANGLRVDEELHLDRLDRSLAEIGLAVPWGRPVLRAIIGELLRRNRLGDAILYIQVTRGAAPREHAFPADCRPTLVMTVRPARRPAPDLMENGVPVITIEDIRWKRADIKSVALLANVMGKQRAREAGAFEAWLVDGGGRVTEGTSTNAWIVTHGNALVTPPADHAILNGVTRRSVMAIARELGLAIEERPFTVAEALEAAEAFLTSTSSHILPVTRIDGRPVGDGSPGRITADLMRRYTGRACIEGEGG